MAALLVMLVVPLGCADSDPSSTNLGPSEAAQEVRAALAEPGILDSNTRLVAALRQLNSENIDAVLAVYEELMRDLREPELRPFFDAWSLFDPAAALDYALSVPFDVSGRIAVQAAMYSWASRDALAASVAAETAVKTLLKSKVQGRKDLAYAVDQSLIRGWALSGQDGLQDHMLTVTNDPGQLILAALPKIYLRAGPEGLVVWCEEFLTKTDEYAPRMKAFRYTARTIAFRDPHAAADFVVRHYGEDYAREGPRTIAAAWIEKDREGVVEWIRKEAPEDSREAAFSSAVGTFVAFDPAVAREWIESLPVGDPFYQPAFDALAKSIARKRPQDAIEWCGRGQTVEPNFDCLRHVAIRWYNRDPVETGRWLENDSGLSIDQIEEIRTRALKHRPRVTGNPGG